MLKIIFKLEQICYQMVKYETCLYPPRKLHTFFPDLSWPITVAKMDGKADIIDICTLNPPRTRHKGPLHNSGKRLVYLPIYIKVRYNFTGLFVIFSSVTVWFPQTRDLPDDIDTFPVDNFFLYWNFLLLVTKLAAIETPLCGSQTPPVLCSCPPHPWI